jgi:hypothetical protein
VALVYTELANAAGFDTTASWSVPYSVAAGESVALFLAVSSLDVFGSVSFADSGSLTSVVTASGTLGFDEGHAKDGDPSRPRLTLFTKGYTAASNTSGTITITYTRVATPSDTDSLQHFHGLFALKVSANTINTGGVGAVNSSTPTASTHTGSAVSLQAMDYTGAVTGGLALACYAYHHSGGETWSVGVSGTDGTWEELADLSSSTGRTHVSDFTNPGWAPPANTPRDVRMRVLACTEGFTGNPNLAPTLTGTSGHKFGHVCDQITWGVYDPDDTEDGESDSGLDLLELAGVGFKFRSCLRGNGVYVEKTENEGGSWAWWHPMRQTRRARRSGGTTTTRCSSPTTRTATTSACGGRRTTGRTGRTT